MSKAKRHVTTKAAEIINLGLNEDGGQPSAAISGENTNPVIAGEPRTAVKEKIASVLRGRWGIVGLITLLSLSALGGTLKYLEQDAQRQMDERRQATYLRPAQESVLSRLNPFLPDPTPTGTPKLSKSYIYAGSRLLAVEDANATPAIPADLAVWRPTNGTWYVMGPGNTLTATVGWGSGGTSSTSPDVPVPGDYDGDGKTDFAVYRNDLVTPGNNMWYIIKSSDPSGTSYIFQGWGTTGDIAVPADYDGDHRTDIAVFRGPWWYILRSSDNTLQSIQFGNPADTPIPGDYDGDGKADAAVLQKPNSSLHALQSTNGLTKYAQLSTTITGGQEPVPGDYDGDGMTDFAMRSGSNWIIKPSSGGAIQTVSWYSSADKTVQNDYDGDGKCDIAVWRGSIGTWYIRQSSLLGQPNELRAEGWGAESDIPVPALWRR